MCPVVVINVRDRYNFPFSENIPSLSRNLGTEKCNCRRLGHAIGQMKANGSTCYNVGAIFDSILSEPCEQKTLIMAEKSPKPLSYFFKKWKQCKDESDKESTTMQVDHEDLNDINDPTKEISAAMAWKLPVAGFWSRKQQHEVQFTWVCLANMRISCDDFSLLWKSHIWTYLFCAVFVILKSTPCLIGKERGKQNIFTSHSRNTNFKLERV